MIRTPKIPFIQSRAAKPVIISTCIGVLVGTILPYTPLGRGLGMIQLPLAIIIICYMVLVTIVKKIYVKKFGELL